MPSDGRYASFPDRTAHSSLTHVWIPTYREDFGDRPYEERILMEGMSDKPPEELVPLAKSWLKPAKLEVKSGCSSEGYDRSQRAYVLSATDSTICIKVRASESSPAVNPAFVVKGWGKMDCVLKINGETIERSKGFRFGHVRNSEGTDLVIWLKLESKDTVGVEIFREKL